VTNSFIRTNLNDLGIGKVIASYSDTALVEYFVSVHRRERYEYARKDVRPAEPLPRHTTCYFLDDDGNWGTGHVDVRVGDGYRVMRADDTSALVSRSGLFARCSLPAPDIVDALINYCFTHPTLHDRRHEFLRYVLGTRAATLGLTGLSSSLPGRSKELRERRKELRERFRELRERRKELTGPFQELRERLRELRRPFRELREQSKELRGLQRTAIGTSAARMASADPAARYPDGRADPIGPGSSPSAMVSSRAAE
jgi:hypothetical protein